MIEKWMIEQIEINIGHYNNAIIKNSYRVFLGSSNLGITEVRIGDKKQ